MEQTLDGHYVVGRRYEEIGVLVDLATCMEDSGSNNETCESKCGCVRLFSSLKNRPTCGYDLVGKPKFEEL